MQVAKPLGVAANAIVRIVIQAYLASARSQEKCHAEYSRPTLPIIHVTVLATGATIAANVRSVHESMTNATTSRGGHHGKYIRRAITSVDTISHR
jgi:hypothetical protein